MSKTVDTELPLTAAPPYLPCILASHAPDEHGRCQSIEALRAGYGSRRRFAYPSKPPGVFVIENAE